VAETPDSGLPITPASGNARGTNVTTGGGSGSLQGCRPSDDRGDGEGTSMSAVAGRFVISFDFELFWGVRDTTSLDRYGPNILGVREAVPRLLELFERHGVHATWGTVGLLFFDDKEELLASLPDVRPRYADPRLSPYAAIADIGPDEKSDPYHFGRSLIRRIIGCPGQEIGTHTFSHYYCLAAGQDEAAFRADLSAARRAAERLGVALRSITFPRHQINDAYLSACRELGLIAFRGQPGARGHDPLRRNAPLRRAWRFADSYLSLSGSNARSPARTPSGMIDVPSSRFLRPFAPRLSALEPLRLGRIVGEMRRAARAGALYHLWWHPHNFGTNIDQNLAMTGRILATFRELALEYGMQASTMGEVADLLAREAGQASAAVAGPRGRPPVAAGSPPKAERAGA
jgi:Polysaccharide deacetylase